jgi:heme-degrading monooxygenase HmoA
VIVRVWRATLDIARAEEYERFSQEVSLPMFREQEGFWGVLFARRNAACVVITLWSVPAAIEALNSSPSYRRAVERIEATELLTGQTSVEVLELHGGSLEKMASGP